MSIYRRFEIIHDPGGMNFVDPIQLTTANKKPRAIALVLYFLLKLQN